jgi:hypothetical protein
VGYNNCEFTRDALGRLESQEKDWLTTFDIAKCSMSIPQVCNKLWGFSMSEAASSSSIPEQANLDCLIEMRPDFVVTRSGL